MSFTSCDNGSFGSDRRDMRQPVAFQAGFGQMIVTDAGFSM